jgi:hypothetical protein
MPTVLKRLYATSEEIPETFQPFFVEKDGKHTLDVTIDGLVPVQKVNEMRDTNIRERQEHEDALKKFEGVDVDEYKDLKARSKDLEDGKLLKRGELEAIVKPRVEEALKQPQAELKTERANNAVLRNRLETEMIANGVVQAAIPLGLKKGAGPDLIERARKVFKLNEDMEVVAYESDGKTVKYHLGSEPYTVEQFAKDTANDEFGKHLFAENQGGGGGAGARGGGGGQQREDGYNPWNPVAPNRSEQGKIMATDFSRAQRLAKKHGFTLKEPVSNLSR